MYWIQAATHSKRGDGKLVTLDPVLFTAQFYGSPRRRLFRYPVSLPNPAEMNGKLFI